MTLRECMIESMRKAGIPEDLIAFAITTGDRLKPESAVDAYREIKPGHEKACLKKFTQCWGSNNRDKWEKAYDYAQSRLVDNSLN